MLKHSITLVAVSLILVGCGGQNAGEYYQSANANLKAGQVELAIADYEAILEKFPQDSLAALAGYRLAQVYLNQAKDYDSGYRQLQKVVEQFPGTDQSVIAAKDIETFPEWLINKAESLRNAKDIKGALETLIHVTTTFPLNTLTPKALYLSGDIYMNDLREFEKAIESYRNVVEKYPGSRQEAHAQFMIGYIHANVLSDLEGARREYEIFMSKFPDHELTPSVRFELEFLGKDIEEIPALKHITS